MHCKSAPSSVSYVGMPAPHLFCFFKTGSFTVDQETMLLSDVVIM